MKYILLALLLINTVIWATPILAAPVIGKLEMPTERTDGTLLNISEIASSKVYFHETITNHWTHIVLTDDMTQWSVDKPPGTYEIFATVTDTGGRESKPSNKTALAIGEEPIIIEIPLTHPMSPILILIN